MAKNAYVLDDHHGDDGTVTEGMILADISNTRFDALEKQGLVREATSAEVKAGYKAPFEKDESEAEGGEKKAPEPSNKKAPEPSNKGA